MRLWEHRLHFLSTNRADELQAALDSMAREGWELAGVIFIRGLIFKRPLPLSPESPYR